MPGAHAPQRPLQKAADDAEQGQDHQGDRRPHAGMVPLHSGGYGPTKGFADDEAPERHRHDGMAAGVQLGLTQPRRTHAPVPAAIHHINGKVALQAPNKQKFGQNGDEYGDNGTLCHVCEDAGGERGNPAFWQFHSLLLIFTGSSQ